MVFEATRQTTRIAIIGAGDVGAAIAFACIMSHAAGEILLVDVKPAFLAAQVLDLNDAAYRGTPSIRAGTFEEAGQCDIIVVTAGAKQRPGESRLELIGRNIRILREVIGEMRPFKNDAILLLVANPVDVLTCFAQEVSGLPREQVIGSGTFLDSIRLKKRISEKSGISANSIEAYVLGEHGDSQFVAWSIATICGTPLLKALPPSTFDADAIGEQCRNAAATIIDGKGATSFGIGAVVSSICSTILLDKHLVRPISHWVPELGCCISLPVVLGRRGAARALPLGLSDEENALLEKSAETLRGVIADVRRDFEVEGVSAE
ncbi:related to lactate dehydrogenase [Cephalotrichum gorgonifer]|uniref:L-lactate dehydrogenase n=1 Tax=Cephalotrichum gorgonifer TaxID=2041049 RepID=A0AAE8N2K8_9PEZI|nr:related to lactate dehydrogenase [Cephalotrichum gorgonifer]